MQQVTALPWMEVLVVIVILALAVRVARGLLEIVIPVVAVVVGYYFVTGGYSLDWSAVTDAVNWNAVKDAVAGWIGGL